MLDKAIALTARKFQDVFDKGGKPYILHCLHVMNKLKHTEDEELMSIAVMHDLLEDTDVEASDLLIAGFSARVVNALICLTHLPKEDYDTYINNILTNKDAMLVKIEDLRHNSDITRLKGTRQKDLDRLAKYQRAYLKIKAKLKELEA